MTKQELETKYAQYERALLHIAKQGCEHLEEEPEGAEPNTAFHCQTTSGNPRDPLCNPCIAARALKGEGWNDYGW